MNKGSHDKDFADYYENERFLYREGALIAGSSSGIIIKVHVSPYRFLWCSVP